MAKEKVGKAKAVDYNSDEVWLPIRGYPWDEVSSMGRVRTKEKRVKVEANRQSATGYFRVQKAKVLRPIGNYEVVLYHATKPAQRTFVSRLVALAFIGPAPTGKPFVLHGDDNRANNQVGNLRWGSHQDNMEDRSSRNRQAKGNDMPQTVLSLQKVRKIRRLLANGAKQRDISAEFGISPATVSQINRNITWKHVL